MSLKVIENYTIQSGTHDFLLTFHSNHRPISPRFEINGDIRRKSPIFPTPVYLSPCGRGSPWNLVSAQGVPNASMMGLPDGRKSFKIGLVVLIQYRLRQTASHPASQPRCRSKDAAYYVARVINERIQLRALLTTVKTRHN